MKDIIKLLRDPKMLKRFILALSFANLCFYNVMFTIFYKKFFYIKSFPTTNSYLALIISEILLTLFFLFIWEIITRLKKPWVTKTAKAFLFIALIIILENAVKDIKVIDDKLFRTILLIATILLIIFKKTTKASVSFLMIIAPFVVIVFSQALLGAVTHWNRSDQPKPVQSFFTTNSSTSRVLWLIFDEMDYQVAFNERPQGVKLPTFDRFRKQAIFAENAFAPSNKTAKSLPALIDGKLVSKATVSKEEDLLITYQETGETTKWGSQPNVFSRAKQLRFNTAFVGEYLPYSRLIGKDLSHCSWYPFYPEYISSVDKLSANIYSQLFYVLAGPAKNTIQRKRSFYNVFEDTKKLVVNPAYGLIMIHFPIPHGPHFHKSHWWERSARGYLNSLELADETLNQLWQILADKGLWDKTTVIISSDHWLRDHKKYFKYKNEDYRIPFMIKLAGRNESISYQPTFNTVITQDLILAIFRKDVTSPEKVIKWLNQWKDSIKFSLP